MIEFQMGTETVLLRVSEIECLFVEQRQIRTVSNHYYKVREEDWIGVEGTFRLSAPKFR